MPKISHLRFFVQLLLTIISIPCFAMNDTTYYNVQNEKSNFKHAQYYTVRSPLSDGKYKIESYYLPGNKLNMTAFTTRVDSDILDGHITIYDTNGHKTGEGDMTHDKKNGIWKQYYENSDSLRAIIEYTDDDIVGGEIKTYYKSGKLRSEETYHNGKAIAGRSFSEDGEGIAFTPYFTITEPEYDLHKYFSEHLHYPNDYSANSGKVLVKFAVLENGKISEVRVIKSGSPGTDKESVRVVSKMPKWKPAELDGKPIKMYFTIPITFRITLPDYK